METKNTTKEVKLQPKGTTEIENKLSQKLAYFTNLQKKVRQRAACQTHLDKLQALQIPTETEFSEEQTSESFGISLKTGYREEYLVKNPSLMLKLRDFLQTQIVEAMQKLDTEILEAKI